VDLHEESLPDDVVGLLAGLTSTRAIRRYHDEPVPDDALRAMLFAATRAPTDSNRQAFRFMVLTDGPKAIEAKRMIAAGAQRIWELKRQAEGYDAGSGQVGDSPKARMARTMEEYIDHLERVPALVLPCLVRHREPSAIDGASIYPACQNLLLAARALGYGGVMTTWHVFIEAELRELLAIPDDVLIAATITLGRPRGAHGPVRRRPLDELVFAEGWDQPAPWAIDPPGTGHTSKAPPREIKREDLP
jgi:nitroreductase